MHSTPQYNKEALFFFFFLKKSRNASGLQQGPTAPAMAISKQPADKPPRRPSTAKQSYLILYNLASAVAWLAVLCRVVAAVSSTSDASLVSAAVAESTKWTQTAAGMDVLHSASGKLVRSA